MNNVSYPYMQLQPRRYLFVSDGKKRIAKVVDFVPLGIGNIMNIGFGDLLPDDSLDDKANSNNGDIIKVLPSVRSGIFGLFNKKNFLNLSYVNG